MTTDAPEEFGAQAARLRAAFERLGRRDAGLAARALAAFEGAHEATARVLTDVRRPSAGELLSPLALASSAVRGAPGEALREIWGGAKDIFGGAPAGARAEVSERSFGAALEAPRHVTKTETFSPEAEQAPPAARGAEDILSAGAAALAAALAGAAAGAAPACLPDGTIMGFGPFEHFDPGWLGAAAAWLESLGRPSTFVPVPAELALPDRARFALVGDWGAGSAAARKVAAQVAARAAAYTVHLGDVYYAGTPAEVARRLVAGWPAGTAGSFALCGNHERLSGGRGLFGVAYASPAFRLQRGSSFFALTGRRWAVVGLDSASHASPWQLYEDGWLDPAQLAFLARVGADARAAGRRVVVLTHHTAFARSAASGPTPLWAQVAGALGAPPAYWYAGHWHAAVVFRERDGCRARCAGHGAMPAAAPTCLAGAPAVEWYEAEPAGDPAQPARVRNGFVELELDGAALAETFFDEDGRVRYAGRAPASEN